MFIRKKTRFACGSVAQTLTREESVRADRRFPADDEAIPSETTIFSKLFAAGGMSQKPLSVFILVDATFPANR